MEAQVRGCKGAKLGRSRLQTPGLAHLEEMEWVLRAQFGQDQDALLQTAARARDGQDL